MGTVRHSANASFLRRVLSKCEFSLARLIGLRAKKSSDEPVAIALPPRAHSKPKGYLAVAAIAKNEGRYLQEWIEFQRLMGVEHIFLYDNGSSDNSADVVARFVAEDFVTLIPWVAFDGVVSPQRYAYAHALCNFGPQFRWMALIDIDEFLFPVLDANLIDVLSRYEDCSCLCAPWFMFGFSGHETPPAGLVIDNYTWRAPYPPRPEHQLSLLKWKSIVHPAIVAKVNGAHLFELASGITGGMDERRVLISRRLDAEPTPGAVLRVNHYFTRSRSEFRAKLNLAKFATGATTHQAHSSPAKRQLVADKIESETVRDETILRFAPALRQRMEVCTHMHTTDGAPAGQDDCKSV